MSNQLSLRWNNHKSTFFNLLSSIRSKEAYCDVTLACDGRFYSLHKFVLSTCSEYFEEMFERTQCKHPVIVLKDIKYDDLEALLNYMYIGEVNVVQDKLADLIKVAECLKIKGLAVPDDEATESKESTSVEQSKRVQRSENSPHPKRRKRSDASSDVTSDTNESSGPQRSAKSIDHQSSTSSHSRLANKDSQSGSSTGSFDQNINNNSSSNSISETDAKRNNTVQSIDKEKDSNLVVTVKSEPICLDGDGSDAHDSKTALYEELNIATESCREEGGFGITHQSVLDSGEHKSNQDSDHSLLTEELHEEYPGMWEGDGSLNSFSHMENYSGNSSQGHLLEQSFSSESSDCKQRSPAKSTTPSGAAAAQHHYHQQQQEQYEQQMRLILQEEALMLSQQPCAAGLKAPVIPSSSSSSSSSSSFSSSSDLHKTHRNAPASGLLPPPPVLPPTAELDASLFLRPQPPPPPPYRTGSIKKTHKTVQCQLCPYKSEPRSLRRHMLLMHSSKRPHACLMCTYRATSKDNLNRHMKLHTGDKPFACLLCPYRAIQKHHLQRHLLTKHALPNN